jgi:hypothetical protein
VEFVRARGLMDELPERVNRRGPLVGSGGGSLEWSSGDVTLCGSQGGSPEVSWRVLTGGGPAEGSHGEGPLEVVPEGVLWRCPLGGPRGFYRGIAVRVPLEVVSLWGPPESVPGVHLAGFFWGSLGGVPSKVSYGEGRLVCIPWRESPEV